jgi:hypothetical protein
MNPQIKAMQLLLLLAEPSPGWQLATVMQQPTGTHVLSWVVDNTKEHLA